MKVSWIFSHSKRTKKPLITTQLSTHPHTQTHRMWLAVCKNEPGAWPLRDGVTYHKPELVFEFMVRGINLTRAQLVGNLDITRQDKHNIIIKQVLSSILHLTCWLLQPFKAFRLGLPSNIHFSYNQHQWFVILTAVWIKGKPCLRQVTELPLESKTFYIRLELI